MSKIKFGLTAKFLLNSITGIFVTAVMFYGYFIYKTQNILKHNLEKKGQAFAHHLSHDSKYAVMTNNEELMLEDLEGLVLEEDMLLGVIYDTEGKVLAAKHRNDDTISFLTVQEIKSMDFSKGYSMRYCYAKPTPCLYIVLPIKIKKTLRSSSEEQNEDDLLELEEAYDAPDQTKDVAQEVVVIGYAQVGLSLEKLLEEEEAILHAGVLITFVIVLFISIVSVVFVRYFIKPIKAMVHSALQIAEGDLTQRVVEHGVDEIAVLGRSFNQMVDAVEKRDDELKESNKDLSIEIKERKRAEQELERNYRVQSVLNSILCRSLEDISLDEILEYALHLIITLPWFAFEAKGAVFLVEKEPNILVLKAQTGLDKALQEECNQVSFGTCLCGQAAVTKEVVFTDHVNNLHEISYEGMESHGHYCVPIMFSKNIIGVITLYVNAGHVRDEKEEEFLNSVANTLAGIIQRKRSQLELEGLNVTLESRIEEEVEKSHQKDLIMMHQSRLAATGEMIGHIAHQWRQPLNALALLLYNIKDMFRCQELDEAALDELTATGTTLIDKMSMTIDDFRNFFRPTKGVEKFNVNQVVKDTLLLLDASFNYYNITVVLHEKAQLSVVGLANEYSQVIVNILNNAKDAIMAKDIRGEILVDIFRKNNFAVVRVRDNGGGVPENILGLLFKPYFTTKVGSEGSGLGLHMSKIIIEEHMQGNIKVRNTEAGAEFTVSIPINATKKTQDFESTPK